MYEENIKGHFESLKRLNQDVFYWRLYRANSPTQGEDRANLILNNKTVGDYETSLSECISSVSRTFETGAKYLILVVTDKPGAADGAKLQLTNKNIAELTPSVNGIGNVYQQPQIGMAELLGLVKGTHDNERALKDRMQDRETELRERLHEKDLEILKLNNEISILTSENKGVAGFVDGLLKNEQITPIILGLAERFMQKPQPAQNVAAYVASSTPNTPTGQDVGALFELKKLMQQNGVNSAYMLEVANSFFSLKQSLETIKTSEGNKIDAKFLLQLVAQAAATDPAAFMENVTDFFTPEADSDNDTE